jgi:hypothetical protein
MESWWLTPAEKMANVRFGGIDVIQPSLYRFICRTFFPVVYRNSGKESNALYYRFLMCVRFEVR